MSQPSMEQGSASPFSITLVLMSALAAGFLFWSHGAPERALAAKEAALGHRFAAGDLVFQDLDCGVRCELIREVTKSRYAHVGIVLERGGQRVVWEAFHPVGPTPLAQWLERGVRGQVAVYRLDAGLEAKLPQIEREIEAMKGRPYDGDYQWDDERIYCSELVAKAVNRAVGEEVFAPHRLGAEALGNRAETVARMSKGRLTAETLLVSPADLTRSPRLTRVADELR